MDCLIYQTITTPDGLVFASYGPEVERHHNFTLYRDSRWDGELENFMLIDK